MSWQCGEIELELRWTHVPGKGSSALMRNLSADEWLAIVSDETNVRMGRPAVVEAQCATAAPAPVPAPGEAALAVESADGDGGRAICYTGCMKDNWGWIFGLLCWQCLLVCSPCICWFAWYYDLAHHDST